MLEAKSQPEELKRALARQVELEAHDRSLIVERLAWSPEERLEANARILRFYLSVRPDGPLILEQDLRADRMNPLQAEEIFASLSGSDLPSWW